MAKYLEDATGRLAGLKKGMEGNPTGWQNQPYTPAMIQTNIDQLKAVGTEIDNAKDQLNLLQAHAHQLCDESNDLADNVESIAIGLEKGSIENLAIYGIKVKQPGTRKPAPSRIIHPSIKDDHDGIGFVLSIASDPDADQYEWQKGVSADASKTEPMPEMKYLNMTPKITFVDDDVTPGTRVFYRVRSVNRSGKGPWSEAVSRVQ